MMRTQVRGCVRRVRGGPRRAFSPRYPVGVCGRYQRRSGKQAIATALRVNGSLTDYSFAPNADIPPSTVQPIVRENPDTGLRDLDPALWGIPITVQGKERMVGPL